MDVYTVGDPSRFERAVRIEAPDYPRDALARHVTGYVDLRGHVSPLQAYVDVEFTPGSADAAIFVESIRKEIGLWEFLPLTRDDCLPANETLKLRVLFDIQGDKPVVNIAMEKRHDGKRKIEVVKQAQLQFPRGAMRNGVEAFIYTRSVVEPDGSVSRVEAQVYTPRTWDDPEPMEREVKSSLAKWRYAPQADADTRRRTVCNEISFRLRN